MKKKENGTKVNRKEEINKKYEEKAEAKRVRWADRASGNTTTEGSQNFMSSEIVEGETLPEYDSVPNFEEAILEEEEYDGQAYVQSEIVIDLRGKNHVFNQTGSHKSMTLYDMLCDNQSTCDVIVNPSFITNIRSSTATLVLKTQAGECRIDQIVDIPGVGTVWFYPNGVANILSQHWDKTILYPLLLGPQFD